MMKIGFFTDGYLPSLHGVTISIETFRKKLENFGNKVFVFAPSAENYKDENPRVIRFKSMRLFPEREAYFALPFLPENHQLKEIIKIKLDICHAHSPFNLGFLGKFISLREKIPLVYTHHTLYSEYAKFYLKENLITPYLARIWSTWFSNLSDLVIAPSTKIKKLLKEYGTRKETKILPTGVDINFFKENPENKLILKRKLSLKKDSKILLFVGRIEAEKNPLFLLEVLKEIIKKKRNVFLVFVGSGTFVKKIKERARKLGIFNFIRFTGRVPHSQIPFYYQGSDIFVFSSFTETQGIVILEAEATGLPPVVIKDGAFLDVIENNKNGFLVKKPDPKLFAFFILKLLQSPSLYKKFSQRSRKIAEKFSQEKQAKKLFSLYEDLIKFSKKK